jgi:hypothetical protein
MVIHLKGFSATHVNVDLPIYHDVPSQILTSKFDMDGNLNPEFGSLSKGGIQL